MSAMSTTILAGVFSKENALAAAKGYWTAKATFQRVALGWVIQQTLMGNADALSLILTRAGMMSADGLTVGADGKAAIRWLLTPTDKGGCGLAGIMVWDSKAGKARMAKGWAAAADRIDEVTLWNNVNGPAFTSTPVNKSKTQTAFDLEARVVALVKKAAKDAGMTPGEIAAHVKAATAKGLLALKAA